MKVGLIGFGVMGGVHAARYLRMPNAELVAIADMRPERLAAKEAVQGNIPEENRTFNFDKIAKFADGSELIAQADVDVVDICLPTFLHARYAVQALEAGRHVICEKPMALNAAEAERMCTAAERAGRQLMIAQCIRFWPEYLFLRKHVQEETFGRLLSLDMYRIGGRPIWSWENWFLDPARSGGPILDLHLHDLDFVHYLLGKPDGIQATARISPATGTYDTIHAFFTYTDGPQVHMRGGWSNAQIPFQAGFDAWFERGVIRLDGRADPPLQVFENLIETEGKPAEYEAGDAYNNEIAYFLRCIEAGAPPAECLPESTRDSLWLIEQEIRAVTSGQTVSGKM